MANSWAKPKPYLRAVVLCVSVVFCPSCGESPADRQDDDRKIDFSANVGGYDTRAVSTFGPLELGTLRASADGFAVSTSSLGSGAGMNNVIVKYGAGIWSYTGNYFWPLTASQSVSFTAYAPALTTGATLTAEGLMVSAFTPAATPASQIDLIYAPPADFNRSGSGATGVKLTFKHLLTQVIIRVEPILPVLGTLLINNVTLSVPNNRGSYNGTTWTSAANLGTYTFFSGTSILNITPLQSAPLLLVPTGNIVQNTNLTMSYKILFVEYTKNIDLSTLTTVKTWTPGSKITYTIHMLLPLKGGDTRSSSHAIPVIEVTATEEEGY